jgi:hypothetical protein
VNHGLFVAAQVIRKVFVLLQCLSYSRYVAVAKNAEAAAEKRTFDSVALDILIFQELDDGLRRRCSTLGRQSSSLKGV